MSKSSPGRRLILACVLVLLFASACTRETPEDLFARAEAAVDQGELPTALIHLKRLLKDSPSNMQARWLISQVYLQLNEPVEAEKELLQALQLGVSPDSVLPALARSYYEQRRFDEVQSLGLDQIVSPAGKTRLAAIIALAYMQEDEFDAARAVLDSVSVVTVADAYSEYAAARMSAYESDNGEALDEARVVTERYPEFVPGWELLGDLYVSINDHERAVTAYSKALELAPNNVQVLAKRGFARLTLERKEEARADATNLLRIVPRSPLGWYLLALVAYEEGDALTVVSEHLDRALLLSPDFFPAVLLAATVEAEQGGSERGLQLARQAMVLAPNSVPARKLLAMALLRERDNLAVLNTLQPVLDAGAADLAIKRMMIAAMSRLGRYREAVPLIEQILDTNQQAVPVQLEAGIGLLRAGETNAAIPALQAALDLSDGQPGVTETIVQTLVQQQDYATAEQFARRELDRAPMAAWAWSLLGDVQFAAGDFEAALDAYQRGLEIDPSDAKAILGASAVAIRAEDYVRARDTVIQGLQAAPDNAELYLQLASIARLQGDANTLAESLGEAVRLEPDAVQPRVQLALHFFEQERYDDALRVLDVPALENNALALGVRAQTLVRMNRLSEARRTMERLVELRPRDANAHWRLAELYRALDLEDSFKRTINEVLSIDPGHRAAIIAESRSAIAEGRIWKASQLLERLSGETATPELLRLKMLVAEHQLAFQEHIDYAKQLVALKDNLANRVLLSRAYYKSGDSVMSREVLEDWLSQYPDDVLALLELAALHSRDDRVDEAIVSLRSAVEMAPDNVMVLNNLAWALKDKEPGPALEYAERALAQAPESSVVLDTYALTLAANRRFDESLAILDELIQASPGRSDLLDQRQAIEAKMNSGAE
jgi:putative PEP-CTERM system TPR-repeat lipoprotein